MRIIHVEERRRGLLGRLAFVALAAFQIGCLMAAMGVQSPAHAYAHGLSTELSRALPGDLRLTDDALLFWAWCAGSLAFGALSILTRGRVRRYRTVAP
ncbi:hypothetical protein EOD42_00785 [Rhodovarius crocodyli]|uniref:Uncharacterized protein n=1 Tax=Rhodovarius crocodyli TaxID=1979269 RepID=A0A437MM11_9PROT|nr:hypothetical protein [Rhodovarius crocodyli]RVT98681.1 hypothetical protein EOD42_00785 [Rhodovarius crocodyli]